MKIIKSNLLKEPFMVDGELVELKQSFLSFKLSKDVTGFTVDNAKELTTCLDILFVEGVIGVSDGLPLDDEVRKKENCKLAENDFGYFYRRAQERVRPRVEARDLYEYIRALETDKEIVSDGHEIVVVETCPWEINMDVHADGGPCLYFYRRIAAAILPIDAQHANADDLVGVA